ncbi:MAG: hypothetical protein PHG16_11050 [Lachnospiraceae bacterium]|nr:hypothetical protein [Lachnospiraceae bacterium]
MLQTFIDMKLFIYGMIAFGVAGLWSLLASNHFYNLALRDLRRMDKPKAKWTRKTLEEGKKRKHLKAESFIRAQLWEARQTGMRVFRIRQVTETSVCGCLALFILGTYAVLHCEYALYVIYQYAWIAGCIAAGLVMIRYCMSMNEKEEVLVEGWKDYMENSAVCEPEVETVKESITVRDVSKKPEDIKGRARGRAEPKRFPVTPAPQEDQISKIANGIRESAAADSRFAGALTPEEEKLLRDVIREYL